MEHGGMPWMMQRNMPMRHMAPPRPQAMSPVPKSPVMSHYPDTIRHQAEDRSDTHKVCLPKFGAVQRSPEGELVNFGPSASSFTPPHSPMLSTGNYPPRVPKWMYC